MADVKDPVEVLAEWLGSEPKPDCTDSACICVAMRAVRELERRARVEGRLEAWLGQGAKVVGHTFDGMGNVHTVRVTTRPVEMAFVGMTPKRVHEGTGFDYWTAAGAALDAAGAPKESE